MVGCSQPLVADTTPETIIVTETVTQYVTVEKIVEVENLDKIKELELQVQKYEDLIGNLNELLSCVYYGYASNDEYILDGFTAFSLEYNDKYYIITAGHAVEDNDGKYYNHRFKANFSDEWIYPELIAYDNDYINKSDYAIFYSDKVSNGLNIDKDNDSGKYILGYTDLNIIKNLSTSVEGESGSPIIDFNGEVIGISTTDTISYYTDIDIVLENIK